MSEYILAIDVGGTFTDVICYDKSSGEISIIKTPSTPPDFIQGMLNGISALKISIENIRLIKVGTTIATNTIIMRTGAKTALLTTSGFTDILHAARAARPTLYDSDWDPAPSLVDRQNTMTIAERITYEGEIVKALDEQDLRNVAKILEERGIEAIAISFLHSYVNGQHERQARDLLEPLLPNCYVCISSETLPEIREFERTSTTTANAYLGPVLNRYLSALITQLESNGYSGPVLITHSGGGVMSIDAARKIPSRICQSGPAAAVVAGAQIGQSIGRPNVIGLDVGGTSADVSLSRNGSPLIRSEWNIEFNIVINFPSVEVVAIGAGGGSIARIDDGNVLKVGPDSAGAKPGPACYGRGGVEPTVTDANLILGRLSPEIKLGGRVEMNNDLALEAINRVAEPINLSADEAASGILRIMRTNMAGAIRMVSVKRGHDPRDFSLVAFGGAGPLHAVELAQELGIPEVIIPYYPGLGSALGVLYVEVRHDFVQSIFATNTQFDVREINGAFENLETEGRDRLKKEGIAAENIQLQWQIDIRFYGQVSGGLTLAVKPKKLSQSDVKNIFKLFHKQHTDEYGYTLPEDMAELEIVNVRVIAEGLNEAKPEPLFSTNNIEAPKPFSTRSVYFDEFGRTPTPIWKRNTLPPDYEIEGPGIVEQVDTTILLPPNTKTIIDDKLNLICSIR